MKEIPLYSSTIMRKEMDAVLTCMVSEKTGPGEVNRRLSQAARELFQMDAALPLRSGAVALRYALKALGLPPGSAVLISALSPAWHYKCLMQLGFEPLIADVDGETAQVTPESVQAAAENGAKAVLLFDALGFLPDARAILEVGVPVIEDISQSAGAFYGAALAEGEGESEAEGESLPEGDAGGGEKAEAASQTDAASAKGAGDEGALGWIPSSAYAAGSGAVFSILGLEERDLLTAGGGAILFAPKRREGAVIRKIFEDAPETDILSDMNSSLALVQAREMKKNRAARAAINAAFMQAIMQARAGRHRPLVQKGSGEPSFYSFPVILESAAADARRYATKQGISTGAAFGGSVAALLGDELEGRVNAKSLLMRCLLFPLYPRLGAGNIEKIAKVLRSLP